MAYALLVDDHVQLTESYKAAAARRDLDLAIANSWDEGLELFHVLNPAVVIADYNMPGSRMGLQLLAEIRRLRPEVRLVLISGYIDEHSAALIEDRGLADRALIKSVSETRSQVMDEIERASRTDQTVGPLWTDVADAHLSAELVKDEDLDELDRLIRGNLGGTR